jgi:class 3 adenylate cyclase
MSDLRDWLRRNKFEQYADAFEANDIDLDILPELTEDDLGKLGVSLGNRRRLLKALAERASDTDKVAPMSAPQSSGEAERRQVTVMFSDLVGSTALSARMDPEDLREVISTYQKCVAETVRRFGGFVAKYMGDGVLVYFGYPEAHEDDAERAVRAGLELVGAVSALKHDAPLQTRVGIATGLVVVGDLIGSGASQEQAIVGETPNLAARLQGIAKPNMVVIAEATRKLLGNLFELEDLGAKDLKGIAAPVRAWAALRASAVESRFEALHATGLTALVGRERDTVIAGWASSDADAQFEAGGRFLKALGNARCPANFLGFLFGVHARAVKSAGGLKGRLETRCGGRGYQPAHASSSSSALACFKSSVSKPSVNQP